jgi:hypothetical protein
MAYSGTTVGLLHIGQVPASQTELPLIIPAYVSYYRVRATGGTVTLKSVASGATYTLANGESFELIGGHHMMPTVLKGITFLVTTGGGTTLDVLAILGNID